MTRRLTEDECKFVTMVLLMYGVGKEVNVEDIKDALYGTWDERIARKCPTWANQTIYHFCNLGVFRRHPMLRITEEGVELLAQSTNR